MADNYWLDFSESEQRHPYKLVRSNRAKYVRIKISNDGDLSVVLPKGISEKHAHSFIRKKSQWISDNLQKIVITDNGKYPKSISLKLLGEQWSIKYLEKSHTVKLLEINNDSLEITGDIEDWNAIKTVINRWCKAKAQKVFKEMLEALAEEHGFHFNRLTIRSQKTRWGSCSSSKNINLNSKLILMPENIVKYVMIHELCHTIEMNHSSRFWQLVEDCDPSYKNNRKQLKLLGRRIYL